MSKIFISLVLVLSLGTASLVAAQTQVKPQAQEVQKLSKADNELLFGKQDTQDVNVALLSDEEMEETQGEFWDGFSAIVGAVSLVYGIGRDHNWW